MDKLPPFEPSKTHADARKFDELMQNSFCSTADCVIPEKPFLVAHMSLPEADLAIGIQTSRIQSANKPVFGYKPISQYHARSKNAKDLRARYTRPGILKFLLMKLKIC